MSDPNSFVNFADYLGLNQEAGADMRARADATYQGPREDQIMGMADQHIRDAKSAGFGEAGGDAQYQASADAVRKGVASYSEFLEGMADPAKRQALMERTYGKGAVSAFDSALVGGQGMAGAKMQIHNLQNSVEAKGVQADNSLADIQQGTAQVNRYNDEQRQQQQARYSALQKAKVQSDKYAHDRKIRAYGKAMYGNTDPSQGGWTSEGSKGSFLGLTDSTDEATHSKNVMDKWEAQMNAGYARSNGGITYDPKLQFNVDANGEGYWK